MLSLTYARWTDDVDSRTNRYVRRWMRHFPLLRATCVENWLDDLREATLPTWVHPLSTGERNLLVDAHWRVHAGRRPCEPEAFDGLVLALEELILAAQQASPVGAAFVRLSYRAPIDSPVGLDGDMQVVHAFDVAADRSPELDLRLARTRVEVALSADTEPKVYFVLEGRGSIVVGEERRSVGHGEAAFAPAGAPHGVENDSDGDLVCLVFMAPHPSSPG